MTRLTRARRRVTHGVHPEIQRDGRDVAHRVSQALVNDGRRRSAFLHRLEKACWLFAEARCARQDRFARGEEETTIAVADGSTANIPGGDFMKAVWSIWLGKSDQPSVGDDLVGKL